ncbi:unnamed protein product [Lupinus luteus]|uniref:Uncharacterized protein n=1 Tax=Lupinus luteus TaxID=3873 RepID=A0AAV1W602_LUPLU
MSHSQPPHHDGVSKASPSHAPQDSTHDDNGNQNHSVMWPHHNWDISPPPHHLYIDMIIQKSDEGHLDIFVKDSNQVKVQSVITVQSAPHHLDLSAQQIHIPYFFSENHPPQKCRVMLKNLATQA